jgi:hypothetical protein
MRTITKVRVVDVDMFGYCGRENHPTKADIGTVLRVLKVETLDSDGMPIADLSRIDRMLAFVTDDLSAVYYCSRPDGTPVDMMDFEIEPA